MKNFRQYADYYDLLNSTKDYKNETDFILRTYQKFSHLETKNILELGCGTGKHAAEFIKRKLKVHGVELSEEMIELGFKHPNYITYNADIVDFISTEKVLLATSLFHVMSYLTKDSQLNKFFAVTRKNLKRNGIFIFDCWYKPALDYFGTPPKTKIFENEVIHVERKSNSKQISSNITEVSFDIKIFNKKNRSNKRYKEVHKMRSFDIDDINSFAKSANLELIHSCEFLTEKKLDKTTWGSCFVLKK